MGHPVLHLLDSQRWFNLRHRLLPPQRSAVVSSGSDTAASWRYTPALRGTGQSRDSCRQCRHARAPGWRQRWRWRRRRQSSVAGGRGAGTRAHKPTVQAIDHLTVVAAVEEVGSNCVAFVQSVRRLPAVDRPKWSGVQRAHAVVAVERGMGRGELVRKHRDGGRVAVAAVA
jgi:hypothetical protein